MRRFDAGYSVGMTTLKSAAAAFLVVSTALAGPGAVALGGGAGGDSGGQRYVYEKILSSRVGGGSEFMVIVDSEAHTIAVYSYSTKDGAIVPVAVRDYRYDLLIEEYPTPALSKRWDKGFSAWEVREYWEDLRKKELMQKEGKNEDEIEEKDLEPPVGSGVGKTFLTAWNTVPSRDSAIENITILDTGSHTDNPGAVTLLTYAVEAGAIVPKAIRTLSQDFNLAKYKLRASNYSFRGDFKNQNITALDKSLTVKEIEAFIEKEAEKQAKKDKKKR